MVLPPRVVILDTETLCLSCHFCVFSRRRARRSVAQKVRMEGPKPLAVALIGGDASEDLLQQQQTPAYETSDRFTSKNTICFYRELTFRVLLCDS